MEQNADNSTPVTPVVDNKQKSGNGLKITTTIACIVAICGIGFGVYGMMQSSQKDNQISDLQSQLMSEKKVSTDNNSINIDTAQVLIDPYLGVIHDSLLFDIFDLWSYEGTDLYVAYLNAKEKNNLLGNTIEYDLLNQEYKYLFGSNKKLEKKDFIGGFYTFDYLDDGEDSFRVEITGGGGTTNILFSVIKDAYKNTRGDAITVEVYHDHMIECSDSRKQHCTNAKLNGYYTETNPNIDDAIINGDAEIYKMVFRTDGDHYVLDSITM